MAKQVIDLSKWNGTVDFKKVKVSGISGVIVRCGYRASASGKLTVDPKFTEFMKGAISNNIPVGVYFFTTAINPTEGAQEAEYVHELVKNYKLSFPVFIDSEYANNSHNGRSDKLTKAQRTSAVVAFCKRIIALGYEAGIYASDSWLVNQLDYDKIKVYNIWNASYSKAPTRVKTYIGWQYTSKGSVKGVNGNVDISYWYPEIKPETKEVDKVQEMVDDGKKISTGDKINLKNASLYSSSTNDKVVRKISGTYYIWDAKVHNNRVRITTNKDFVGKANMITGWVKYIEIFK